MYPLLAGEVVNADQQGVCASMNQIIATLPKTIPTAYAIPSNGCLLVATDCISALKAPGNSENGMLRKCCH